MTKEQMNVLLSSQQGELDAVVMYQKIADTVDNKEIADELRKIGADEGKHASVFYNLTKKKLTPNDKLANTVVKASKILGKKITFKLMAIGEYRTAKTYKPVVSDFPEVATVQSDERKHGDHMMELSKRI